MIPEAATQREWLRQGNEAGPALAATRREELLHLSDERALAASEALLSLVTTVTLNPGRVCWSGLVEQQALFHRRPSP
jgi:ectoine hydroxylase-related dioxygenase (phytanoyl-CoA dioxygenase family)